MKVVEVKKLKIKSSYPDLDEISAGLDRVKERIHIDMINWKEFTYIPRTEVALSYSNRELFLKYYITEDYFKAEKTETNQMVCEDSCVEFFLSPEDDGIYYNLEFNGIGTILMGAGTARGNNSQADPVLVSKIRRLSSAGSIPFAERAGKIDWTLTIAIPFEVFFHHKVKELKGKFFRANFYKCGDMLSVPHYVTWNQVRTERPDYHQPAYFGILKFV